MSPRRKVHVAGISQRQALAPAIQHDQEILCQPSCIDSKAHAHHGQRQHARRALERLYLALEILEYRICLSLIIHPDCCVFYNSIHLISVPPTFWGKAATKVQKTPQLLIIHEVNKTKNTHKRI